MDKSDADIHSLILDELRKIGCKNDVINEVSQGKEVYSENGVLDSASLVQLIAGLSDFVESYTNGDINLFSIMDENFLFHFKNIHSLTDYLIGKLKNA